MSGRQGDDVGRSYRVSVDDVEMSGRQDDDGGGEYPGSQQVMGQIPGRNRPIVVLFLPFPCFRRLPPASASFRLLPPGTISTRIWEVWAMSRCLGDRMMMDGGISGRPTGHGPNFRIKSADSRALPVIFCFRQLPSAPASVRHLPPATISTRTWAVWAMATYLGDRAIMAG